MFTIFASRDTWASKTSKELRREEAQDERQRQRVEDELWNEGFEINDVWEREEEPTPTRRVKLRRR
jgi:hypothetical protein